MKKIIYLLLVVTQICWAQSAFEIGNQYYQKGNYKMAISSYESILKSSQHSEELYFNLANSYYKLNQVAPAIYNYEKALLLDPKDKDILNNLGFAQKMTIDEIVEVPKVGFSKFIDDFTSLFPYDTWAWLAIIFSFGCFACFLGYYFSNKVALKRIFFVVMVFSILLTIVSFSAGFNQKEFYEKDRPAIVFQDVVTVKSEPKSTAQTAFVVHAGTKVFVLDTFDDYKKIQLLDLKTGWIPLSAIKEVK